MDNIHDIRFRFYEKGEKITDIAKTLKLDRKTVQKYVDKKNFNEPQPKAVQEQALCPKLEPYKPIIDSWLEKDKQAPRKQRHTAKRVFDRLNKEAEGFDCSYRTVATYYTNELINQTLKAGIEIAEVYGDKAYFRKPILDNIKEIEAKAYIPVSESVYRIDESEFSYNKDSDEWQCSQGNITVTKKYFKTEERTRADREGYRYYFELKQCKDCPKHSECAKTSARKILQVGLNTAEFYEISQYQKTEEYQEKYKKRASIEGKNAELKRFHGLCRARGYGLLSVSIQSKLAAIAVNIKRIAAIATPKFYTFYLKREFLIKIISFVKISIIIGEKRALFQ